jgi:hypothetical protein
VGAAFPQGIINREFCCSVNQRVQCSPVYQFFYVECAAMRALWMFIKFFLLLIIGAVGAMFALENG